MPEALDQYKDHSLTKDDLEKLEAYIKRARELIEPLRDELKAIVKLKRAKRLAKIAEKQADDLDNPRWLDELPDLYGNHQIIPLDWQPSPRTVEWVRKLVKEREITIDLSWLVAEFVTYWRGRGRVMANWQQAFRNNVLQKLGRGFPLGPPQGIGSGRPITRTNRVFDRPAEVRKQRLNDFDEEAARILGSRSGGKTDGPVGKGD